LGRGADSGAGGGFGWWLLTEGWLFLFSTASVLCLLSSLSPAFSLSCVLSPSFGYLFYFIYLGTQKWVTTIIIDKYI
jgi:hypothetical protein